MTTIKIIPDLQPWEVMKRAAEGEPVAWSERPADTWSECDNLPTFNWTSFRYAIIQPDLPWPQHGNRMYIITDQGNITSWNYTDDLADKKCLTMNNAFRTEAEAIAKRDWLQDPRTHARFLVEQCEGYDPNADYLLYWDKGRECFSVLHTTTHADGGPRFTTYEQATACHTQYPAEVMLLLTGKEAPPCE